MSLFNPKNNAEILKTIKQLIDNRVEVSNNFADTEDMNKALNSVQANPDVEGTLANQIADNTKQINVLSDTRGYINSPNETLDLNEVRYNCKKTIHEDSTNLPYKGFATLECIFDVAKNGVQILQMYSDEYKGCMFSRSYNEDGWSSWKLCNSITSTLTPLNRWAVNLDHDELIVCRTGDLVNIHGTLKNDSAINDGSIIATLPDIYKPSVLRRSVGVLIDSKTPVGIDINTDGSIKWYGGARDSVGVLRIDTTYAI